MTYSIRSSSSVPPVILYKNSLHPAGFMGSDHMTNQISLMEELIMWPTWSIYSSIDIQKWNLICYIKKFRVWFAECWRQTYHTSSFSCWFIHMAAKMSLHWLLSCTARPMDSNCNKSLSLLTLLLLFGIPGIYFQCESHFNPVFPQL